MFQNDASVSTMKTRSKTLPQINWDYCKFCRQKTIKKDSNLSALKAANTCIHSCFKENETRDFYSPISSSQLKTFEDLTKRCNLKCRSGEVIKAHIRVCLQKSLGPCKCTRGSYCRKGFGLPNRTDTNRFIP